MSRYIFRRVLWMLLTLLVVSLITFGLMHAVRGGPFDQEKTLPKEIQANLKARYHLDEPLYRQYLDYVADIVIPHYSAIPPGTSVLDDAMINIPAGQGWVKWINFGPSYVSRSRTVNDIFRQNLPVSVQLGFMAFLLAVGIGVPLGILAALRQNTFWDYAGMSVAIFGVSVPVIILAPILIWVFAVTLKWLPATGWASKPPFVLGLLPAQPGLAYVKTAAMPVLALGLAYSALIARLMRASLLQVIREDYLRTARAKGLGEGRIILRHALKNSLLPVVTIMGPLLAALLTGTFITETIFGIPGMGRYFVTSISNRDYPVIMSTILLYAVLLVICNLLVDITYAWLDPRIRYN